MENIGYIIGNTKGYDGISLEYHWDIMGLSCEYSGDTMGIS